MEVKSIIVALILLLCGFKTYSQIDYKPPRILFLLDGSADMLQKIDSGQTRFDLAKKLILKVIDSAYHKNNEVEFALHIYGHQSSANDNYCSDSKLEVNFSKNNFTQIQLRLDDIKPKGISPLGYAINNVIINDIQNNSRYKQTIILISTGLNSCSLNPCNINLKPNLDKLFTPIYTVIIGDNTEYLKCLGNHSIINTSEGEIWSFNAILNHCGVMLTPRAKRVNQLNTLIPQNIPFKVSQTKKSASIANPSENSDYSGYLKIRVNYPFSLTLLNLFEKGNFIFVDFSTEKKDVLLKGDPLLLKAGEYTLKYYSIHSGKNLLKQSDFTIIKNMVTEIPLNE